MRRNLEVGHSLEMRHPGLSGRFGSGIAAKDEPDFILVERLQPDHERVESGEIERLSAAYTAIST